MSALRLSEIAVPHRLHAVSAEFPAGTLTGLIGPNGSGKSTLLQVAAGVLPSQGMVHWLGRPLASYAFPERGRTATWVPQEAHFEFGFSVRAVVSQGRYAHGDDHHGVEEALRKLDLVPIAERPVNQLSGGERHRVLLARALANHASIQLWDEPLASLDPRHALEVIALANAHAAQGGTVIVSLHDLRVAYTMDRIAVLHQGRLLATGNPRDVLTPELLMTVFGVKTSFRSTFSLDLP